MAEEFGLANLLAGQSIPADESGLGQIYGGGSSYTAAPPTSSAPAIPEGYRPVPLPNGGYIYAYKDHSDAQAIEAFLARQGAEQPQHKPIPHGHAASREPVAPEFKQGQRQPRYEAFDPISEVLNAENQLDRASIDEIPRAYKYALTPSQAAKAKSQEEAAALAAQPRDPEKQGFIPALGAGFAREIGSVGRFASESAQPFAPGVAQTIKEITQPAEAKAKELHQPISDIEIAEAKQKGFMPYAGAQLTRAGDILGGFAGEWGAPGVISQAGVPGKVASAGLTFAQLYGDLSRRAEEEGVALSLPEKYAGAALSTAIFQLAPNFVTKGIPIGMLAPSAKTIATIYEKEGVEAAQKAVGSIASNIIKSYGTGVVGGTAAMAGTEAVTRHMLGQPQITPAETLEMAKDAAIISVPMSILHGRAATAEGRRGFNEAAARDYRDTQRLRQQVEGINQENAERQWPEMRTEGRRRDQAQGTEHIEVPAPAEPAPPTGEVNLLQPVDWHPVGDGYPNTVEGLKSFISHHKDKLQSEVARRNPEVEEPIIAALKEANNRLLALRRTVPRKAPPEPTGISPSAEMFPWPVGGEPAPAEPATPEAPAPIEAVTPEAPAPVEPVTPEAPAPVEQPWPVEALGLKPNAALTKRLAKLDMNNPEHIGAISDELNKTRVQIEPEKLAALSNHFEAIKPKEVPSAEQIPETGAPDGSGGPQPIIREEGGDQTVGGKGVEPSGQGEQAPEDQKEVEPLTRPDKAYHAGDLGYGADTGLGRMSGGRGTGHFGTGVYFVGDKAKIGSREERPVHEIDFSDYNLARPATENDAQGLHDGLRIINRLVDRVKDGQLQTRDEKSPEFRSDDGYALDEAASKIRYALMPKKDGKFVQPETIAALIKKHVEERASVKDAVANRSVYEDTAATRVMKDLGYEGVDVRHLPKFDNVDYGSVIYKESLAPKTTSELEAVKPKEAPPAEEQESPKWLQNHADELGGTAVHNKDDIGLVRGYGKLSGQPVYVGAKGNSRTLHDIDMYSGQLFTPEELTHLRGEKARLVAEDQAAHEANPEGPFAGRAEETLVSTESVPKEIHDTVKDWLGMLGISDRVHLATVDDAKAMKGKAFGPFSRIPSQTLDDAFGSKRRLPNGVYSIVYKPHARMSLNLETLGHEIGHVLQDVHFDKAPVETQKAIRAAHDEWLKSTLGMEKAQELINSTRGHTTAKFIDTPEGKAARDLDPYWTNFREWFADQTGRWAMTDVRPVGVVERFFARLGRALRGFYQKNKQYLPHKTMADWLNSLGPSRVEAIAHPENPIQAWQALREAGHPEWKNTSADVKQAWRDAFNVGAATKEFMNKLVGATTPTEAPRRTGEVEPKVRTFEDEESRSRVEPSEEERERPPLTKVDRSSTLKTIANTLKRAAVAVSDPRAMSEEYAKFRRRVIAESAGLTKALESEPTYDPETGIRVDYLRNQYDSAYQLSLEGLFNGVPVLEPKTGLARIQPTTRTNLDRIMADAAKLPLKVSYDGQKKAPLEVMGDIFRIKMGEQELKEYEEAKTKLRVMEQLPEATRRQADAQAEMSRLKELIYNQENGIGREQSVTREDIRWANDELQRVPGAQDILDRWGETNQELLRFARDTNWLSPEKYEEWSQRPAYIPMYKPMEDILAERDETPAFPGGGPKTVGKIFPKTGASSAFPINVFESMSQHYTSMLTNSMMNNVKHRAYQQLERVGLATRVPPSYEGKDAVKARAAGKDFLYKVKDEEAFRSLTMANMYSNPYLDLVAVPANVVRRTALFLNPAYYYRTMIHDPLAATMTTMAKGAIGPVTPADALYQLGKRAFGLDKSAKDLQYYGISGLANMDANMHRFARALGDSPKYSKWLQYIDKVHSSFDDATRTIVYEAAKKEAAKQGITDPQVINDIAAVKARDFADFAAKGSSQLIRIAGKQTPFLHAHFVGLDKMLRAATGHGKDSAEGKAQRDRFISSATIAASTVVAITLANIQDKRYRDLPIGEWSKNIVAGFDDEGRAIKIPVPQEIGFWFKFVPELMTRMLMGVSDKPEASKAFHGMAIDTLLPPGLADPVSLAIRGWLQLQTNTELHSGLPIESPQEQLLLPEDRDKRATIFGKTLRDQLKKNGLSEDFSPDKFDSLMRAYLTSMYDNSALAAAMIHDAYTGKRGLFELPFNKDFTEVYPGAKAFYSNPRNISATPRFYDMAKPLYETLKSVNAAAHGERDDSIERFDELRNDPVVMQRYRMAKVAAKYRTAISSLEKAIEQLDKRQDLTTAQKRKLYWDRIKDRNELARTAVEEISKGLMQDKKFKDDVEKSWQLSVSPEDLARQIGEFKQNTGDTEE